MGNLFSDMSKFGIELDEDMEIFEEEKKKYDAFYVELTELKCFWPAEEYHQDYLEKNPHGYCHIGNDTFEKVRNY